MNTCKTITPFMFICVNPIRKQPHGSLRSNTEEFKPCNGYALPSMAEQETGFSESADESEKTPLQEIGGQIFQVYQNSFRSVKSPCIIGRVSVVVINLFYSFRTGSDEKSRQWHSSGKVLARNKRKVLAAVTIVSVILLVIVAVVVALLLILLPGEPEPWTEVRLPTTLQPQSYALSLSPDLETMQVQGSVSITLLVNETTEYVILHASSMEIDDAQTGVVGYSNSESLEVKRMFWYTDNDFYVVEMASKFTEGESIGLSLSFSYTLATDLQAFYNSSYIDQDGTKHVLATTQFEPTSARKAFPCFDEPAFKANFSISITHDPRYNATSNMPAISQTSVRKRGEKVTTKFQTSVKMSTYLVAFVVSDLKCTDPLTIDNRFEVSDQLVREKERSGLGQ